MNANTKVTLIGTLASLGGVIFSVLFGLGTVAPQATVFTYVALISLVIFQYFFLAAQLEWASWKIVVLMLVILLPELLALFVLSFLWFLSLPVIAVLVLTISLRK